MNVKKMKADFSGLCGEGGQELNFKVPVIRNPGKSSMQIGYAFAKTRDQKNRVCFIDGAIDPSEYTERSRMASGWPIILFMIINRKFMSVFHLFPKACFAICSEIPRSIR